MNIYTDSSNYKSYNSNKNISNSELNNLPNKINEIKIFLKPENENYNNTKTDNYNPLVRETDNNNNNRIINNNLILNINKENFDSKKNQINFQRSKSNSDGKI